MKTFKISFARQRNFKTEYKTECYVASDRLEAACYAVRASGCGGWYVLSVEQI